TDPYSAQPERCTTIFSATTPRQICRCSLTCRRPRVERSAETRAVRRHRLWLEILRAESRIAEPFGRSRARFVVAGEFHVRCEPGQATRVRQGRAQEVWETQSSNSR